MLFWAELNTQLRPSLVASHEFWSTTWADQFLPSVKGPHRVTAPPSAVLAGATDGFRWELPPRSGAAAKSPFS